MESTSAPWLRVGWIRSLRDAVGGGKEGRGRGDPPHNSLVDRTGVQAQRWRVQTRGRVAEVRFLDPQQGGAVLALLALAVATALVAHRQQGDEQDGEDGEGVEEDEVEERLAGADDRVDGGLCGTDRRTRRRTSVALKRLQSVQLLRLYVRLRRTGDPTGNMAPHHFPPVANTGNATNLAPIFPSGHSWHCSTSTAWVFQLWSYKRLNKMIKAEKSPEKSLFPQCHHNVVPAAVF